MINIGSKKINYFLSSLILFIWSAVFYMAWNNNPPNQEVDLDTMQNDNLNSLISLNITSSDSFYYIKLNRNPFLFDKITEQTDKPKSPKVSGSISMNKPIRYKINGVILNNKRKIIILENLDESNTVFLREGESYKTILIKSILKNKIILIDGNEEKTIQLNIQ
jgi:hypothetical protein